MSRCSRLHYMSPLTHNNNLQESGNKEWMIERLFEMHQVMFYESERAHYQWEGSLWQSLAECQRRWWERQNSPRAGWSWRILSLRCLVASRIQRCPSPSGIHWATGGWLCRTEVCVGSQPDNKRKMSFTVAIMLIFLTLFIFHLGINLKLLSKRNVTRHLDHVHLVVHYYSKVWGQSFFESLLSSSLHFLNQKYINGVKYYNLIQLHYFYEI